MSIKRIILAVVAVLGICFIVGIYFIGKTFLEDSCTTTFLDSELSPSTNLKMTVYNYDCGASSGLTTNISLQKADLETIKKTPEDNEDALFIADDDHAKVPALLTYKHGGPLVNIIWHSEKEVEIEYPEDSRVFKNLNSFRGIEIKYSPKKTFILR